VSSRPACILHPVLTGCAGPSCSLVLCCRLFSPSEISVTYGSYQCILSTAQKSANTWINCQTVPGAGALIKLRVTTGSTGQGGLGPNEQSVLGLNTYTYPVSPVVDKVTGCGAQNPQSKPGAAACPLLHALTLVCVPAATHRPEPGRELHH
jgi:hypothetical protein